ncbi:MAG: hypothetical protein MUO91_09380 [candidate division Zixibacteria bacterium]|nr:hypothetical protein [candidate division Zixibacteria bacterium]
MARTNFNIEQNLQNILDLCSVAPPEAGLVSRSCGQAIKACLRALGSGIIPQIGIVVSGPSNLTHYPSGEAPDGTKDS